MSSTKRWKGRVCGRRGEAVFFRNLLLLIRRNARHVLPFPHYRDPFPLWPSFSLLDKMTTWVTTMRVTPVKEFKAHATRYLREREPILITRRGKLVGFFIPVEDPSNLPPSTSSVSFCSS